MPENNQSDLTKEEKSYRNKSTGEIEEDIRHTQHDIDETLDALEQKFSPGELLDKMIHSFGDTPREYADNLGRVLKENPVPATLTGISLAWLMASTSLRSNGDMHAGGHPGKSKAQKLKNKYHQAKAKVGETADSVKGFVSDKVDSTTETATETGSRLGEKGSSAYDTSRQMASRTKGGFVSLWNEHPVMLAAAGLAFGAALGMGLPRTRKEDELMGETRDHLKHEAEQAAREQAEKSKEVAKSAVKAAKKEASAEAEKQDLTNSSDAKEGGSRQASSARDVGTSTAISDKNGEKPSPPYNEKIKNRP